MWKCNKCGRGFGKKDQMHSCKNIPPEEHFRNKKTARELFDVLKARIEDQIGRCRIVSLPCCIHLYGSYDFLAALPKKDRLEVRFALDRKLDSPRFKQGVPLSAKSYKNCVDITDAGKIDDTLLKWLKESYHLKDKHESV
jgi:hypothetical protein